MQLIGVSKWPPMAPGMPRQEMAMQNVRSFPFGLKASAILKGIFEDSTETCIFSLFFLGGGHACGILGFWGHLLQRSLFYLKIQAPHDLIISFFKM